MARNVTIQELMQESGVGFGTSGARGLVAAMTDAVCSAYAVGFLRTLERRGEIVRGSRVGIGGDLRPSTGRIMAAVAHGIAEAGYSVLNAGRVPSPALALLGLERRIPTMMVTGSHIPDDRNGIKFNKTTGEILKPDEQAILRETVEISEHFAASGSLRSEHAVSLPEVEAKVRSAYVARWIDAFPKQMLASKRVVVYGHSAVGRDVMVEILRALGAEVIEVAWSERFIPVDTEAIRPEDTVLAADWAKEYRPFSIVSTDGDSDRPLVSDEFGKWLRGDVLGVLTARFLGADAVVTPVSSNSVVERSLAFECVARTKIGSPYVIARMQELTEQGFHRVVGYEANGGFLTATSLTVPAGGQLSPLATRDPVIVMLSVLGAAVQSGRSVSALERELPERVTASGRIQNFPSAISVAKLGELAAGGLSALDELLHTVAGKFEQIDLTDGIRGRTSADEILHLRASGNAPELRCYAEASNAARSAQLVEQALDVIRRRWT
jgi:phosphomannomutase